jgi:hypothetical protein
MPERTPLQARLRRAEQHLAEADRLLQRRRTELGGPTASDFEDQLLQGVRELAAVVRDLAAQDDGFAPVSDSHAAELAASAATLDAPVTQRHTTTRSSQRQRPENR